MFKPSRFYVNNSAVGTIFFLMDFFGADGRAVCDFFLTLAKTFFVFANDG